MKYFVLHAPRQTDKTSALLALRDLLNGGGAGDWRCVYVDVEAAQAARENVADAMRTVLYGLEMEAQATLGDEHVDDLGDKLRDERVRRVVEPILAGAFESRCSDEDIAYAHDLGLVALDPDGTPRIANRIYSRGGAAASEPRGAGDAAAEDGLVRGRRRRAGRDRSAGGVSDLFPGALRALGAALQAVPRGGAATVAAGVSAAVSSTAAAGSSASTPWGAGAWTC